MLHSNDSAFGKFDKNITSDQNPVFRALRECLSAKGIKKHELFLVSGARVVSELLERYPEEVRDLIFPTEPEALPRNEFASALLTRAHDIRRKMKASGANSTFAILGLDRSLFDELDVFGTHTPILVLRTPEIPSTDLSQAPQGLELLCALGDPANLGALIRSAAAFGASKIVLLQESASPFHPKAVRAASGTTLMTPYMKGPSIQEFTNMAGPTVALHMQGEPLGAFKWPKDVRLLIGEEGMGIPKSIPFQRISIPMANGVESLNATVAAGVALYSYSSCLNSTCQG